MPDENADQLDAANFDLVEIGRNKDGKRVFETRGCRMLMRDFMSASVRVAIAAPETRADDGDGDGGGGGGGDDGEFAIIEVTASSTGVDHHGTEMTLDALSMMADQMRSGVVYTPSHWSTEWDQVMGRTLDASITTGRVVVDGETKTEGEGHILNVKVGLYKTHEKSVALLDALARGDEGMPIGTSIGGWFTKMEFIFNDDDEVERVLIKGVELDHLATTRRPSNRESWIKKVISRACSLLPTPAPEAGDAGDAGEGAQRDADDAPDAAGEVAPDERTVPDVPPETPSAELSDESNNSDERENADETGLSGEAGDLDTRSDAGEAGPGPAATRGAASTPASSPETGTMSDTDDRQDAPNANEDRLVAIERDMANLTNLLTGLSERFDKNAPTDAGEGTDDREATLEQKLRAAELQVERLVATAGRSGNPTSVQERIASVGGFGGLAERARAVLGDNSILVRVCSKQADARDAADTKTPSRGELENDLRSVLAAGLADGVIVDPYASTGF